MPESKPTIKLSELTDMYNIEDDSKKESKELNTFESGKQFGRLVTANAAFSGFVS